MKEKFIFTRRIASELRTRGFKIIRTDVNWHKPEFDVWIFEDTPELNEALLQVIQELKEKKN